MALTRRTIFRCGPQLHLSRHRRSVSVVPEVMTSVAVRSSKRHGEPTRIGHRMSDDEHGRTGVHGVWLPDERPMAPVRRDVGSGPGGAAVRVVWR